MGIHQASTSIHQDNTGAIAWAKVGPMKHFAYRKQVGPDLI